jgi:D-3-phosphoglycerate dehydrogenase / 2-oxoglutarate reductase
MSKKRVLISVGLDFKGAEEVVELLTAAGFEVEHRYGAPDWSDADTIEKLQGVHALLAGSELLDQSTLAAAGDLEIIARNGAGYDKVDLDYCTGRGIYVTTTPGAMADAVADEALGLVLALARKLVQGDRAVKDGGYEVPIGEDLAAMTLGLVGCGHIGREVVARARAFKMRVLVYDPWIEAEALRQIGAEKATLEEMLPQADAITLHTPLTAENHKMVNADFLARLKEGAVLINTARGGLVDEEAVLAALRTGRLAGAGLDCQATEPPTGLSLELVRHPHVIAMPHAGSFTHAGRKRMALVAAGSIAEALSGQVPSHVINTKILTERA